MMTLYVDHDAETFEIGLHCWNCKHAEGVIVNRRNYREWDRGNLLAQLAFPELDADTREFLITKLCPSCFHEMFDHLEDE